MSEPFPIPAPLRLTLAKLADVVCGNDASDIRWRDEVDHVELTLGTFPAPVRWATLAGLAFFELSAALVPSSRGRTFSSLPRSAREIHFRRFWESSLPPLKGFAIGAKALLAYAHYEQPEVQARIEYAPVRWIAEVAARRRATWAEAIAEHDRLVRAPDPLCPRPRALPVKAQRTSSRPGGFGGQESGLARPRIAQMSAPAGLTRGNEWTSDRELSCDVVVVGSGAGGAVVAAELAEAGFDVIVVEEGGYHATEEFSPQASTMVRALYRDGGVSTTIGRPPVQFVEGCAVGGSTVINGGMSWRTPERILDRWQREEGVERIAPAEMERYFARVERFLSVSLQDPETVGRDNQLLRQGAERLGWRVIPNLRNQVHCAGTNNGAFGCPTGAKRSTLVTYIPRALHFGARLLADCRVERLLTVGKRVVGVRGRVKQPGGRSLRFRIDARATVVAGGALQTPALLLRSGIGSPSGRIGRDLWLHPNAKVLARFDEPVAGWKGVHQAYQVCEFKDEGILMAAVNLPPAVLAMMLPLYGAALRDLLADYNHLVTAGVLAEDTVSGRVWAAPGGWPLTTYSLSRLDGERLVRGVALLCDLLFAAGAKRILLPFHDVPDLLEPDEVRHLFARKIPKEAITVETVHVMGTARMGGDPVRHVCDSFGKVYDSEGLYVADASLFPTPIGVNPMETIMALATRNAEHWLDAGFARGKA
jgi:choline dehydrogenase-like flavoprotein